MKIDKKLIKELVDNLKEFELTELEYQDGQTKIKVSKTSKAIELGKTSSVVSPNKSVLKSSDEGEGIRIKSPIIGTAYLAPEPGAKKFVEIGDKVPVDATKGDGGSCTYSFETVGVKLGAKVLGIDQNNFVTFLSHHYPTLYCNTPFQISQMHLHQNYHHQSYLF